MLNPNAKLWVEALRSNEFNQSRMALRNGDGFCCMGVGCEVAKLAGAIDCYEGGWGGVPNVVRDWLGLNSSIGSYGATALTRDNDERRLTFHQIADIIESEPEGLFKAEAGQ